MASQKMPGEEPMEVDSKSMNDRSGNGLEEANEAKLKNLEASQYQIVKDIISDHASLQTKIHDLVKTNNQWRCTWNIANEDQAEVLKQVQQRFGMYDHDLQQDLERLRQAQCTVKKGSEGEIVKITKELETRYQKLHDLCGKKSSKQEEKRNNVVDDICDHFNRLTTVLQQFTFNSTKHLIECKHQEMKKSQTVEEIFEILKRRQMISQNQERKWKSAMMSKMDTLEQTIELYKEFDAVFQRSQKLHETFSQNWKSIRMEKSELERRDKEKQRQHDWDESMLKIDKAIQEKEEEWKQREQRNSRRGNDLKEANESRLKDLETSQNKSVTEIISIHASLQTKIHDLVKTDNQWGCTWNIRSQVQAEVLKQVQQRLGRDYHDLQQELERLKQLWAVLEDSEIVNITEELGTRYQKLHDLCGKKYVEEDRDKVVDDIRFHFNRLTTVLQQFTFKRKNHLIECKHQGMKKSQTVEEIFETLKRSGNLEQKWKLAKETKMDILEHTIELYKDFDAHFQTSQKDHETFLQNWKSTSMKKIEISNELESHHARVKMGNNKPLAPEDYDLLQHIGDLLNKQIWRGWEELNHLIIWTCESHGNDHMAEDKSMKQGSMNLMTEKIKLQERLEAYRTKTQQILQNQENELSKSQIDDLSQQMFEQMRDLAFSSGKLDPRWKQILIRTFNSQQRDRENKAKIRQQIISLNQLSEESQNTVQNLRESLKDSQEKNKNFLFKETSLQKEEMKTKIKDEDTLTENINDPCRQSNILAMLDSLQKQSFSRAKHRNIPSPNSSSLLTDVITAKILKTIYESAIGNVDAEFAILSPKCTQTNWKTEDMTYLRRHYFDKKMQDYKVLAEAVLNQRCDKEMQMVKDKAAVIEFAAAWYRISCLLHLLRPQLQVEWIHSCAQSDLHKYSDERPVVDGDSPVLCLWPIIQSQDMILRKGVLSTQSVGGLPASQLPVSSQPASQSTIQPAKRPNLWNMLEEIG